MGICCSKKRKSVSDPHLRQENQSRRCRAPPPPPHPLPLVEEETVKEVLSETAKPSFLKIQEAEKRAKKAPILINGGDEASEASEICSESMSTATITEKKGGEEEEVGMRPKEVRSPAKIQRKRAVPGGRSPAKRSEPSPVRRMPVREGQLMHRAWVPAGSGGIRRDLGENSGRRSRSPATRNDLCRSASARKTCRSPRRIPAGVSEESSGKLEEWAEGSGAPPVRESLENPLVSLECFIFL